MFVYQADDDTNTPAADARAFAAKHRGKVTLERRPTGGYGGAYTKGRGPAMDFLAAKLLAAGGR
ncbi:MAG: hypothetical protein JWO31_3214 [Phycisphaerales bacterium]|nr:hypothetical protein [Phycisphaerales bacterium]